VDRNTGSQIVFGRASATSVERAAGRQWLRWWGCGSAAVVLGIGIPVLIMGTYNYDENLRDYGTPKTAQVLEVDPNNAGSDFTVRVGDRDVELTNPKLVPKVGDSLEVVEDEDGRVVLADDVGAKDKAIGDAGFGAFLSVLIFIGLGWGPGIAPFKAVKRVRDKQLIKQSTVVTVTAVEKIKSPQGPLLGAWRRGNRRYYAVDLRMPDKRLVRWRGPLAREPEVGTKVSVVAGGFPDDWVVMVTSIKGSDSEAVHWPVTPLTEVPEPTGPAGA
jgi:hypothetical protein